MQDTEPCSICMEFNGALMKPR